MSPAQYSVGFAGLISAVLVFGTLFGRSDSDQFKDRPALQAAQRRAFWAAMLGFSLVPISATHSCLWTTTLGTFERTMCAMVALVSGYLMYVFRQARTGQALKEFGNAQDPGLMRRTEQRLSELSKDEYWKTIFRP